MHDRQLSILVSMLGRASQIFRELFKTTRTKVGDFANKLFLDIFSQEVSKGQDMVYEIRQGVLASHQSRILRELSPRANSTVAFRKPLRIGFDNPQNLGGCRLNGVGLTL